MSSRKPWIPLLILFIILNTFFLTAKAFLLKKGFDQEVLIGGNLVLFAATALSFYVSYRSIRSTNPHASVRSLYGSFMIKFFIIVIAAFVYILSAKKNLNKPALFACMGLYLVYTMVEVASLQKMLRQKKAEAAPPQT